MIKIMVLYFASIVGEISRHHGWSIQDIVATVNAMFYLTYLKPGKTDIDAVADHVACAFSDQLEGAFLLDDPFDELPDVDPSPALEHIKDINDAGIILIGNIEIMFPDRRDVVAIIGLLLRKAFEDDGPEACASAMIEKMRDEKLQQYLKSVVAAVKNAR